MTTPSSSAGRLVPRVRTIAHTQVAPAAPAMQNHIHDLGSTTGRAERKATRRLASAAQVNTSPYSLTHEAEISAFMSTKGRRAQPPAINQANRWAVVRGE